MVSENAIVICDAEGIHLYHIPELSSAEDFSTVSSVWMWSGDPELFLEWFCGSICMTPSRHPVLYLQGTSGTHTISFRKRSCARVPLIVEHHTIEELPAHLTPFKEDAYRFLMKGRKGLSYNVGDRVSHFDTCLLGREELTGWFSADVGIPGESGPGVHKVKLADFDERTGRILIYTEGYDILNEGEGVRIDLADLPPYTVPVSHRK